MAPFYCLQIILQALWSESSRTNPQSDVKFELSILDVTSTRAPQYQTKNRNLKPRVFEQELPTKQSESFKLETQNFENRNFEFAIFAQKICS